MPIINSVPFLSKQDFVNIHVRNIQQLMIEIFECLEGIFYLIMNKIYRLRNIPCTIRNPTDLDSRLPKTVYYRLETLAYKGPQLWQHLPAKIKKSSSLVSLKQNIKLWKDPKCSCQVYKTYIGGLGFI